MAYLHRLFARLGIMGELISFFWDQKLWWLIPLVCLLLAFGVVIIASQGTVIAPFIYTLF